MLTPREIVAEAWAITTKESALKRWGFFSSIFETLRSLELLLYQAYYLYWWSKDVTAGWFDAEVALFQALPLSLFIVTTIVMIIVLVFELFAPTMATGAVIGLAAKSYRKESAKGGLVLALYNFAPILEIHGMFLLSSIPLALSFGSFTLRYVDSPDLRVMLLVLIAFLFIISTIFHFLGSFAEEGVVIHKLSVFEGIGRSFKIIISNLSHIMFLILLLLMISLRIFINAIILLLLPAIIIGISVLLQSFLTVTVSIIITVIVSLLLLFLASYFFAYLHVFKQTVWTITYLELNKNKDLDVIE